MNHIRPFLILILWHSSTLPAAETVKVQDHTYPVQIEAQQASWKLQGTEHYKYKIFFSVFTAALYQQENGTGQKLRFTYTRSLKGDDLREQAMKTLTSQHGADTLKTYEDLTAEIQAAYTDVKKGDAYTITVHPGRGVWLHFNDREVFYSDNAEFGEWYLGIWLGDPPIDADLKKALLKERSS